MLHRYFKTREDAVEFGERVDGAGGEARLFGMTPYGWEIEYSNIRVAVVGHLRAGFPIRAHRRTIRQARLV